METTEKPSRSGLLIFILGAMTALGPFTIDTYLPAFNQMAADLGTTVARVSLSLSSYFIGIAAGQLIYGPLLDRFGRKPPLYAGLLIYLVASIACANVNTIEGLIFLRAIQALGGCVSGVAAMAMVRDLFTPQESAKVFSLLVLILGASPLLAPTIGGYLASGFGWNSIFVFLTLMGTALVFLIRWKLPETHPPDKTVILHPLPIAKGFWKILKQPQFRTYALMTSIAFSGLFIYLAGSPSIFLGIFGVDAKTYGWIFAIIASGFIASSQLNVVALKRYTNSQLLWAGMMTQVVVAGVFFAGSSLGVFGLTGTVVMLFLFLSCFGFVNPNATSLVLAPFPESAGRAAALLGFLQMGIGATASMLVGLFSLSDIPSVAALLLMSSFCGLLILVLGTRRGRRALK